MSGSISGSMSGSINGAAPLVSVGMPVYNMEDTVGEAIDTVLSQTFTDFELIICDNASTDGTGRICQAAADRDPRVRYQRNSNNILGENFRLCVLLSRGKYFLLAAADDSRKPQMIERCLNALESHPDAAVAYPHVELFNPDNNSKSLYFDSYRLDQDNPEDRYISLIRNLDLGNPIYGLFRKELFFQIPPYGNKPHLTILTDNLFLANIVFRGKIIQIPEVLFIRRRGSRAESWQELLANRERRCSANYMLSGVSMPVSESIQQHILDLLESGLPQESIVRLIKATYSEYARRYGKNLTFEIDRAVSLAREGRFMETWNGSPAPHPDKNVQHLLDKEYAQILYNRFQRTSAFVTNHEGLHLGKAYCLAKMERVKEGQFEGQMAKEIIYQKSGESSFSGPAS